MKRTEALLADLNAHRARLGLGPVSEQDLEHRDKPSDLDMLVISLGQKARRERQHQ